MRRCSGLKSGPSNLVVMAFSVLNHKYWPYVDLTQEKPDYSTLDVYGANEMSLIIENYKTLGRSSESELLPSG